MKACLSCEQQNPDDAQFCHRCGIPMQEAVVEAEPESQVDDEECWRVLIGPNKSLQFSLSGGWSWKPASEHYLKVFQRFTSQAGPQFALSWHWPAFLFDPFLWFLYRKMYMYALVYAIGPVISAFITGDFTVGVVWRVIAGASANYLYYWHLKDHLLRNRERQFPEQASRLRALAEEGGVQVYVLWLGVALHVLMVGILISAVGNGPPEGFPVPNSGMPNTVPS